MHDVLAEKLYKNYTMHGFISEQEIFKAVQENNIPLFELEYICDQLLSKGVVIRNIDEDDGDSENDYDRSSTDYEAIYNTVCDIEPSLCSFISYVQSIQPPQNKEWRNLLPKAQNGNLYARNRIFEMYMRVAVKMALSFSGRYGLPLADTIQDGMIGLYTAINKFEYGKQDIFTTYFPFWIRQNIMREAATRNPTVYIPVHVKDRVFSIYDIEVQHSCEMCENHEICPMLISEIAQALDCEYEEALRLYKYIIPFESVEELLEKNQEMLSDKGIVAVNIDNSIIYQYIRNDVLKVISTLTEKEKFVVCERYGLIDEDPKTLESIGNIMCVTRERIRQIEAKAIRKLQRNLRIQEIKDVY